VLSRIWGSCGRNDIFRKDRAGMCLPEPNAQGQSRHEGSQADERSSSLGRCSRGRHCYMSESGDCLDGVMRRLQWASWLQLLTGVIEIGSSFGITRVDMGCTTSSPSAFSASILNLPSLTQSLESSPHSHAPLTIGPHSHAHAHNAFIPRRPCNRVPENTRS
jgi:hypothetical protein